MKYYQFNKESELFTASVGSLFNTDFTIDYTRSIIYHQADSMLAVVKADGKEQLVAIKHDENGTYASEIIRKDAYSEIVKIDFHPQYAIFDVYAKEAEGQEIKKYPIEIENNDIINGRHFIQQGDGAAGFIVDYQSTSQEHLRAISGYHSVNLEKESFVQKYNDLNDTNGTIDVHPCWTKSGDSERDMFIIKHTDSDGTEVVKCGTFIGEQNEIKVKGKEDEKIVITNNTLSNYSKVVFPNGVYDKYVPIVVEDNTTVSILFFAADKTDEMVQNLEYATSGSLVCSSVIEEAGTVLSIAIVQDDDRKKIAVNGKEEFIDEINDETIKMVLNNTTEMRHHLFNVKKDAAIEFLGNGLSLIFDEGVDEFKRKFIDVIWPGSEEEIIEIPGDGLESESESEEDDEIVIEEEVRPPVKVRGNEPHPFSCFFVPPSSPELEPSYKQLTHKHIYDFCEEVRLMVFNSINGLLPINAITIETAIDEAQVNREKMDKFFGLPASGTDKRIDLDESDPKKTKDIKAVLPKIIAQTPALKRILAQENNAANIYQLKYILALFIRGCFEQKENQDALHFPLLDTKNLKGFLHKSSKYKVDPEFGRHMQRVIDLMQEKNEISLQTFVNDASDDKDLIKKVNNYCLGLADQNVLATVSTAADDIVAGSMYYL